MYNLKKIQIVKNSIDKINEILEIIEKLIEETQVNISKLERCQKNNDTDKGVNDINILSNQINSAQKICDQNKNDYKVLINEKIILGSI